MPNDNIFPQNTNVIIELALEDFNIDFHTYLSIQFEIFKNVTTYMINISEDITRDQMIFSQNILLAHKQNVSFHKKRKVSFTDICV